MTIGRTISIYLPDANPQGIKICDFLDSIVKTVSKFQTYLVKK